MDVLRIIPSLRFRTTRARIAIAPLKDIGRPCTRMADIVEVSRDTILTEIERELILKVLCCDLTVDPRLDWKFLAGNTLVTLLPT